MAQYINTNIASLNAQRNLNSSQGSLATSLQRLSTGLRINSAKDDAAGLAVSQRMSAQIRSLNQAVRNANDGVSMLQTAESGMNEIQNMLQRMKELGSQAANGTIGDTERGYLGLEISQLKNEIDAISGKTTFNGQYILNGSLTSTQSGTSTALAGVAAGAGAISNIDVSGAVSGTTFTLADDGTNGVTLSATINGNNVTQTILYANAAVAANSSTTLDFSQLGVKITIAGGTAGDTGANVVAALDGLTVVTAASSGSLTLQVGSGTSVNDQLTVSFADARITGNANAAITTLRNAITAFTGGTSTQTEATTLMSAVDGALDYFSSERAKFGAVQNRLESTVTNLQANSENLSASRSRITDADFAAETANLTRAQILQQAGTAMLAQANALPQNVLTLLRG